MAADANGNVFVTGNSNGDYLTIALTIAYSSAGVPLWTNRFHNNLWDRVQGLVVASNGNVIITGQSLDVLPIEYVTISYSGIGTLLWTKRFAPVPYVSGQALAVDRIGNVFVSGITRGTGGGDPNYVYVTLAYSSAGVPLWTNRYSGPQSRTS